MGDNMVSMDALRGGGDIARRLMAAKMDPGVLRSFIAKEDGRAYVQLRNSETPKLVVNATLTYDEWKTIDTVVAPAAVSPQVGAQDLVRLGLVYNLGNGLASTVLQSENSSDISDAELSIAGDKPGIKDRPNFETIYLPLPIIHKDFQLSIRVLEASRKNGDGLDLFTAELAARKVGEKIEDLLFNGTGTFTFGGGTIYGYCNHPYRNTVSMGTTWATDTGANIMTDVLAAKAASVGDKHYGPWILYLSSDIDPNFDNDFKVASDLTIRQRIKEVDGILDVKAAYALPAATAILAEMQSNTVRLVNGLDVTTVEWDSQGGMLFDFKVMAIAIPQIRSDQNNGSGIVHIS